MPRRAEVAWTEHAAATLREGGHRRGQARQAVIELLGREDCALSAREIDDRLRARGQVVGLASIYRTLELLTELRLVGRLEVGTTARYERMVPGGDHHHHLVCDRCGRLTPFDDAGLERSIESLSRRLPFSVDQHDVVLRGACERCRD